MKQTKNWILGGLLAVILTATALADYQKGENAFIAGDYATALAEWMPVANGGNANAQHNIGVMYDNGLGVRQDKAEAVRWYRLAAENKYTPAQVNLGSMYANGEGVARDDRLAYMWFSLAITLGDEVAKKNRRRLARRMSFTQLTEALEMTRQHCLTQTYKDCNSEASVENHYRKATLAELTPLAEAGDVHAQFRLGEIYAEGKGILQDYVEAVKWYRSAAKAGHIEAQITLGGMYREGEGVTKDYKLAAQWYRLAATIGGDAHAQFFLGIMYGIGQGVSRDNRRAYMWLNLSAAQGHGSGVAAKSRDRTASSMTPAALAEAQKMAKQCLAQNYRGC